MDGEVTITLGEAPFNHAVVQAGHTDRRFVLDLQDAFTDAVCERFDDLLSGTGMLYRVLWVDGVDDPAAAVEVSIEPETNGQEMALHLFRENGTLALLEQMFLAAVVEVFTAPDWVEHTPKYAGMAIALTLDQGDAA